MWAAGAVLTQAPAAAWTVPRLVSLAALICLASVQQIPQLADNPLIKPVISVAEFGVLFMMLRMTPRGSSLKLLALAAMLVVARFFYGWFIANLQYSASIVDSVQEARFGIMIVIAPVAYLFIKSLSFSALQRLVPIFAVLIAAIDLLVLTIYGGSGLFVFGERGNDRFVMSVITPLALLWVKIVLTQRFRQQQELRDLALLGVIFLHIGLITTSRTEAILASGVLAQWIYLRTPNLRWPMVGAMGLIVFLATSSLLGQGDRIAGRDFNLALIYTREAFPFGVGLLPEVIQKAQLGRASDFYSSDYGILVLVYRYGLLGLLMAVGLLGFWATVALRTLSIPGSFLVAVALLFYLAIIPILDYGSMNGGIMLGTMAAIMAAAYRDGASRAA